ncbi:type VI secretion protein [Burkholderia sp. MSMB617WGS]|uniref:type VI secretion system baseplate subunit TssF n=1 Tax=Burkholderia sp. MSMB617WGS TaxID=1637831 RepID=UPI00075FB6DD|nr:type VI secretion system baseplate subunit TssF [Burkholderia sp. MSMB617WGS]AOK47344.1 type VI secretion protein [Burkholderia sp. MSMB617WGS]
MDELLSYYERELAFLRRHVRDFAERYPKIASRMQLASGADGSSEDPQVERLFESFALTGARASQHIEDDYSEFTKAFVEVLYPHYLRAFPSCSIAAFDVDASRAAQMSAAVVVPRGTQLYSRPVKGAKMFFRTAYDVTLSPLQVSAARFHAMPQAPMSFRLPPNAGAQISLTFAIRSPHACVADLKLDTVRLYVRGEPLLSAALRDALSLHAVHAYVESAQSGRWAALGRVPFSAAGVSRDDSLIPCPDTVHPAYPLLTEYFAFPEKFGFFDCDLREAGRLGGRQFTLHLLLKDIPADSAKASVLESLSAEHVRLGCTPVINLFETSGKLGAQPGAASGTHMYPLVVDKQNAYAYEVYSVDAVTQVEDTPQGERITAFRSLHSLYHGGHAARASSYWRMRRDALIARSEPGHELSLGFVDGALDPVAPPPGVDFKLTCSNRDLPEQLPHGAPGGDLMMEGGTLASRISLLQRPTRPLRLRDDRGALWRLISQLSLNSLLLAGGAGAVRDMLKLHDLQESPATVRQIAGIVDVSQKPVTAWVSEKPFASVVRGLEIRITVDEDCFAGTGVHTFAQLMDCLLSQYVAPNGFTQLVLVSSRTGDALCRRARRSGGGFLI